ncbi:hypothetical protein [uncultured Pontibacter sp.]|uniref:hypothetical protein n=1 Tax=uncultured Pontibacter sp. TaxID=453356 RepID=UPI00261B6C3D|nr:hypothetical protein [uncultured Pontibacter sp.]
MEINLVNYRGHDSYSFTGRSEGEHTRKKIGLDKLDINPNHVIVRIPGDTTSINPSFFLGLFYESIKKLELDRFKKKYEFSVDTDDKEMKTILMGNIAEAIQYASNFANKKSGISSFI